MPAFETILAPLRRSVPAYATLGLFLAAGTLLFAGTAAAEDVADTGDTAWMMTSTLLVLLMALPGLALFYGGLVRTKNLLSVLMSACSPPGSSACSGSCSATAWPSARATPSSVTSRCSA